MFKALAFIFGYLLKFWFSIFGNYGVAVILFTITIKAIILPLTIKQQRSTEKTQELQPKLQALQEKYKDDQEKLAQEYQKFMTENKYNPFGGCLIAILQIFIILGVFYVVANPIQYMEKYSDKQINIELEKAIISQDYSGDVNIYKEALVEFAKNNKISGDYSIESIEISSGDILENDLRYKYLTNYRRVDRYSELKILKEKYDLHFLGIDLGDITANHPTNWKLWVFPILTTVFYYISMWMISRKQKKMTQKIKDADGNEIEMPNMMAMNFTMPLLSGWISYSVPQSMGLYWFANSLLQIIIQFFMDKTKKNTNGDSKILEPIEAVKENDDSEKEDNTDDPISKTKAKKIEKNKNKKKKK